MIERLLLFGATGDLAGRWLLPALASLRAQGALPKRFEISAAAREDWDDTRFARHVEERLARHAAALPDGARAATVSACRYAPVDLGDDHSVARVVHSDERPLAAYLALPPAVFAPAIEALTRVGLPEGSRVAVEKPFGEDLDGARRLNTLVEHLCGEQGERAAFRVDHFLGMPGVQRLTARPPAAARRVEIVWDETLALEGRAGYYDRAGALRDVVQNHLVQVLCLLAMEPPAGGGERELRDAKVAVLRSVRPPDPARSRRARYEGYVHEEGVDPDHCTETYAQVELELDDPRWAGTRFVLQAAKAMARDRKEVVVDGDRLPLVDPAEDETDAYARVLGELLRGDSKLSVRGDEAEEAWRVFAPVLDAWAAGEVPLEEYPRGSEGLAPR